MGYNVKVGKGGHGPELYDENGKYTDNFSFDYNGTDIKNYNDFKTYNLKLLAEQQNYAFEDLDNAYNSIPDFKKQIDTALMPQYTDILKAEVEKYNATQVWDTPEECVKHFDELITPTLVQNLLQNRILETDYSEVAPKYRVSTFAACFQMSRYKKNVAKKITEQEFNDRIQKAREDIWMQTNYYSDNEAKMFVNDYKKEEKDVPIARYIATVEAGTAKRVLESFYDENSPQKSCLAHYDAVNGSIYGSVIYCMTGKDVATEQYATSRSNKVYGFMRLNQNSKILIRENGGFAPVSKFRIAILNDETFMPRIIEKIRKNKVSKDSAQFIAKQLKEQIQNDIGFCAILMGYDALLAGGQFDILNLGKCEFKEVK